MTSDAIAVEHSEYELLLGRLRVGLSVVFVAFVLFALADVRLAHGGSTGTHVVRIVQFVLVGAASLVIRRRPSIEVLLAMSVGFVSGIYVTSAIAGALRGDAVTQPITDLVIAFATATTVPWGAGPQLASVAVALLAIAGNVFAVKGGLGAVPPHVVAGVVVAFLTSVYIAWQLERYRRERDHAEQALRQSERRFRALVESAPDVITILDGDGVIRYSSPAVEHVLGYRPEDLCGRRGLDFVHPDDYDAAAAVLGALVHHAGRIPLECRCRRKDGGWVHADATCTNLLDDPTVAGIVINWRDVTERARYMRDLAEARDQALSSTRAKSEFLANMSHEIRTPMNAIIGMTDLALDTELTAEQRDYLATVRSSAIALLALLNDILDYSKIEAGKLAVERIDLDVRAVVEDVAELLARSAADKGLELIAAVDPAVPERLRGDPLRLRQVLTNLVGNAVKFTERGEIVVSARVVRATATSVVLRLAVADTGIGIPADRRDAIFESFTQADMSTTRRFGGTGLGLAISRQLVELMDGRIGVESEPGHGSTFWIELALPAAPAVPDAAMPPAGSPRVLVADPSAASRRALGAELAAWGCVVSESATRSDTLAALATGRYDVAFVAAQIGDVSPAAVAAAAPGARVPSARLVLFAADGPALRTGGAGSHFAAVLAKPWRRATLRRTLLAALGAPPADAAVPSDRRVPPSGVRILVAEDDAASRRVVLSILERTGAHVDLVRNGREAVDAFSRAAYDLVLMDIQMPEMDGFEATRRIRAEERGTGGHVPIVAITAHAMAGDRERCLAAGMDDYLTKPVRLADLDRLLDRLGRVPVAAAAAAS